jgi:short-subunit dehydrogenase
VVLEELVGVLPLRSSGELHAVAAKIACAAGGVFEKLATNVGVAVRGSDVHRLDLGATATAMLEVAEGHELHHGNGTPAQVGNEQVATVGCINFADGIEVVADEAWVVAVRLHKPGVTNLVAEQQLDQIVHVGFQRISEVQLHWTHTLPEARTATRDGRVILGEIERGAVQATGGPWHDWVMRWNRALVTRASSGIGRAIAQQLAADGTQLVIVARDRERLEALASEVDVDCEVRVADLSDRDAPANVVALHCLSQVAAEVMGQRDGGGILNVSSVAACAPGPNSATYAATKAFVSSLSEALHAELIGHHVHVTALCPGFTRTEFQDRADFDASKVPDRLWQSADDVADAGLRGIDQNRAVVVPGGLNKVGAGLLNALPDPARRFLVPPVLS